MFSLQRDFYLITQKTLSFVKSTSVNMYWLLKTSKSIDKYIQLKTQVHKESINVYMYG